jgi:hypothetical protein
VVISLGVAHLLGGVADLVRNRARVKFSLVHALWIWSAFCVTVGNWGGLWALRPLQSWPGWSILLMVAVAATCYFICYFVTPPTTNAGAVDLREFHKRERANYLSAFVALSILSLAVNPIFGAMSSYMDWVRDSAIALTALAFVLLPLLLAAQWAQLTGAIATALLGLSS